MMQTSLFYVDGGNVELVEIDGPVVYLRLQGACGSCPSSLTTMTMGIKRRLQEKIPVRSGHFLVWAMQSPFGAWECSSRCLLCRRSDSQLLCTDGHTVFSRRF